LPGNDELSQTGILVLPETRVTFALLEICSPLDHLRLPTTRQRRVAILSGADFAQASTTTICFLSRKRMHRWSRICLWVC
jgi:hypothetical protein